MLWDEILKMIVDIFYDGSEHIYQIPTVRIQIFSLREISEKYFNVFIPYTLLRFWPRLKSRHSLTLKELTDFMDEVIVILQTEYVDGYLTGQQFRDFVNLFRNVEQRVFVQHRDLWNEVERMTKPLIELPSVREGRRRTMSEKELELTEKELELTEKESEPAEKERENRSLKFEIGSLNASF